MDLQFFGADCLAINGRGVKLVVDDNLAKLGGKSVLRDGDVALVTNRSIIELPAKAKPKIIVDGPGEFEVNDVSVYGIAARGHMDEAGQLSATMYKLVYNDLAILITGHIYPELNEAQLEQIGEVDAMFVPVGGNGYTLDAAGALKLIRTIEPKLVIPAYYADKTLKYEVPAQSLADVVRELAMEPKETTQKLKLKPGELSDVTQLVVLEPVR